MNRHFVVSGMVALLFMNIVLPKGGSNSAPKPEEKASFSDFFIEPVHIYTPGLEAELAAVAQAIKDHKVVINNNSCMMAQVTAQTANLTTVLQNVAEQEKVRALPPLKKSTATDDGVASVSWWQWIKSKINPFPGEASSEANSENSSGFAINKRDLIVKALIASYIVANYRLFSLAMYLQSPERWALWRNDLSLTQLMQLPRHDIAQELALAAHTRYGVPVFDATQDHQPLDLMLKAFDEEVAALISYQRLVSWVLTLDALEKQLLEFCGSYIPAYLGVFSSFCTSFILSRLAIKSIFYTNEQLYQQVQERRARITYLQGTLKEWIAELKVKRIARFIAVA